MGELRKHLPMLLAVLLGAGVMIPCSIAIAQTHASAQPSTQLSPPRGAPGFEVTSVRIVPPGRRGLFSASPYGSEFFTLRNVSLANLVQFAFGVLPYQISGQQELGTEEYDVAAKPWGGKGLTYKQLAPLVQQLLRDRFDLKYHYETKIGQGYVLVVAKRGPKLRASKKGGTRRYILPNGFRAEDISMSNFAGMLTLQLKRPVIDKTGLTGHYDIRFACNWNLASDSPLPSVFTAVQEDLGLKLESGKVPAKIMVIDHVDRVPAQN